MVTKPEATANGQKFAEKWDNQKHVDGAAMKEFIQDLNKLDAQAKAGQADVKWAELAGASDKLADKGVLPKLGLIENKADMRNCRIVGATADEGKDASQRDLVVAIGRAKDEHGKQTKAEHVVILGKDGKFYRAEKTEKGYTKTDEVIANNAAEFESKFKGKENTIPKPTEKSTANPSQEKVSSRATEHGGKIMTRVNEKGEPTEVLITHGANSKQQDLHLRRNGDKWEQVDASGKVVRTADSVKLNDQGNPVVNYCDQPGNSYTYLPSDRVTVTENRTGNITKVINDAGKEMHFLYDENHHIKAYTNDRALFRKDSKGNFTVGGAENETYTTTEPIINAQTGEVIIESTQNGQRRRQCYS